MSLVLDAFMSSEIVEMRVLDWHMVPVVVHRQVLALD